LVNVLYISYDGLTDPLGQSQVLPYLLELSKQGFRLTIVSFEKKERFKREAHIVEHKISGASIVWIPLSFTAKPPVLSKIWDRYRMKQTVLRLYMQTKFALVHCRSYVAAEVGLYVKARYGTKLLFDMRGFWADEKVDSGQWDVKKVFFRNLYRFYKRKENEYLLKADGIVSLTQNAKAYLLQQPQYKHLCIDVIPCCADLDHFNYEKIDASEVAALKEKLNIPHEAKILTYLGSVGGWYMVAEMLRFFQIMRQTDSAWLMLILTKEDRELVAKEAALLGISDSAIRVTYAPRASLPTYLALSHYSIFFIRDSFSKKASSPTKHAELMGMGIPVICNSIGDTGSIVSATKTGILVDAFDERKLCKKVAEVLTHEPWDKAVIRNAAFQYFDLHAGVHGYLVLYNRLLSSGTAHASA
jgi:glycosyltransferase involved in cell wall biosynthesis